MKQEVTTDLFGNEAPVPQETIKQGLDPHQQMIALYGKIDSFTCKSCQHLKRSGKNRPYFKCSKFGITHSAATDWRAKWTACGLFKERN